MGDVPWIDWEEAARVGVALVPAGPRVTASERDQIVAELRADATRAAEVVIEASRLPELGTARELVVDRATMVRANVETARAMVAELGAGEPGGPVELATGRARGAAVGAVLALLGGRILGQYEPFGPRPSLLLSAPTIMAVERSLHVVPADFRMWVVLHEQTHRIQFANAPWLREHMVDRLKDVIEAEEESGPLWTGIGQRLERIRHDRSEGRPVSLQVVDAVSSPATVAAIDQITAVMSLLEGHADVMMDRAGHKVIPTVRSIRAKFNKRRQRGGIAGLVNKLLGMDAKLAQYSDGAAFCRHVARRADLPTLNQAFAGPAHLPTLDELLHPDKWLARIG